ncbi:MAG TPA: hypothetical protein PLF31_02450 [Candidatus Paceibacterota bacterium]|nr:hypothetical protein [Candidatus Paceibacterota bacterium]
MHQYSRLAETPLLAMFSLTAAVFCIGFACGWMISAVRSKNKDVLQGLMLACFFVVALPFAYRLYATGYETGIHNGKVIGRDEVRNARELQPSTQPTASPYPDPFGDAPES